MSFDLDKLPKLDRLFCGSPEYRSDRAWCRQGNREPIAISAYSIPEDAVILWRDTVEVQVCSDFRKKIPGPGDGKFAIGAPALILCNTAHEKVMGLANRAAADLRSASFEETSLNETSSTKGVNRYDIRRILLPLTTPYERQNEEFNNNFNAAIDEITALVAHAQSLAGNPEERGKALSGLEERLDKLCVGVDPELLRQIEDDCLNVMTKHERVEKTRTTVYALLAAVASVLIIQRVFKKNLKLRNVATKVIVAQVLRVFSVPKDMAEGFIKILDAALKPEKPAETPPEGSKREPGADAPVEEVPPQEPRTEETLTFKLRKRGDIEEAVSNVREGFKVVADLAKTEFGPDHLHRVFFEHHLEVDESRSAEARLDKLAYAINSRETRSLIDILRRQLFVRAYHRLIPEATVSITRAAGSEKDLRGQIHTLEGHQGQAREIGQFVARLETALTGLVDVNRQADKWLIIGGTRRSLLERQVREVKTFAADVKGALFELGRVLESYDNFDSFSRLAGGGHYNTSSVNNVLQAIKHALRLMAERRNVSINIEKLPVDLRVESPQDQATLYKALIKPVSNAIRHSSPQRTERHVSVNPKLVDGVLEIVIADNGLGMGREVEREYDRAVMAGAESRADEIEERYVEGAGEARPKRAEALVTEETPPPSLGSTSPTGTTQMVRDLGKIDGRLAGKNTVPGEGTTITFEIPADRLRSGPAGDVRPEVSTSPSEKGENGGGSGALGGERLERTAVADSSLSLGNVIVSPGGAAAISQPPFEFPKFDFDAARQKIGRAALRARPVAIGSLPFGISLIGADIVTGNWERLKGRTVKSFAIEYGALTAGNMAGKVLAENTIKVAFFARKPFLGGVLKRFLPLTGAITALEISNRTPISAVGIGLGVTNCFAASSVVHGALHLAKKAELLRKAAIFLRLMKAGSLAAAGATGGATLLGVAVAGIAEMVLIEKLGAIENAAMANFEKGEWQGAGKDKE